MFFFFKKISQYYLVLLFLKNGKKIIRLISFKRKNVVDNFYEKTLSTYWNDCQILKLIYYHLCCLKRTKVICFSPTELKDDDFVIGGIFLFFFYFYELGISVT